jgi:probable H4MPT-linked C1 transfer pathway protein
MNIIGLDVGGANLKAALPDGTARSKIFELWKFPELLGKTLSVFLEDWNPAHVGLTMTGELCDCFETKREGVARILEQVEAAFPQAEVRVWTTAGSFVTPDEARREPIKAAAANWHALAALAGRLVCERCGSCDAEQAKSWAAHRVAAHWEPGLPDGEAVRSALMIDVGSTTTDIIPIADGRPTPLGLCDIERLRSRELVYTGARRTPVCTLLHEGVMAECFATVHDAYLRLGMVPDDPADNHTADGRPATARYAHGRLARMLGGDPELTSKDETLQLAQQIFDRQRTLLADAIATVAARLPEPPSAVVFFGSGEFLGQAAWVEYVAKSQRDPAAPMCVISLSKMIGPEVSASACAYAVALLAEEECSASLSVS